MATVSMEVEVSVAANSTNDNVFAAKQYQTIPFNAKIRLLDTGSATGLKRSLSVGGANILDAGFVSTQNRKPLDPDDTVIRDVDAIQGMQVFCPVQNTTAGALTYRGTLWIEEAEWAE